ncbi:NADH-quinone oxidoreductase subunit H [Candidatus Thorarchaeota archaeon]|nr:MAG: NADH-quinone oxidoreductase subunit H [Candidatus Thorarchaeota archaeon]
MVEGVIAIIITVLLIPAVIVLGLLFEGMDRKLHARMQERIGPPLLQPIYDFIKLFGKEQLVPEESASLIFSITPVIAAICPIISSVVTLSAVIFRVTFMGDIILILYLINMPSIMYAIGGASSGNPYGAIGFSRSLTMMLSYELILIMSLVLTVFKTDFTLASYTIIQVQESLNTAMVCAYPSMLFAAASFLVCIPAAVAVVPFDIPEAKTEIAHGPLIEYTGSHLALMKLSKTMLAFNLTVLSTIIFFNHPLVFSWGGVYVSVLIRLLIAFVVMFFTITLPRTIFARSKPYQAFKFYWHMPFILILVSIFFVMIGM